MSESLLTNSHIDINEFTPILSADQEAMLRTLHSDGLSVTTMKINLNERMGLSLDDNTIIYALVQMGLELPI